MISKPFLGLDCANKTLAWSHVIIDLNIIQKLEILTNYMLKLLNDSCGFDVIGDLQPKQKDVFRQVLREQMISIDAWLDQLQVAMSGFITYNSLGVKDVLNGKKVKDVSEVNRTKMLWEFLTTKLPAESLEPDITVVIERQNKIANITNAQSTAVSHQLMFYYVNNNPVFIDPKNKNKLVLGPGLTLERFIAEEMPKRKNPQDAKYSARKKHAKFNWLFMLDSFGLNHVLKGIPKPCYDDVADSTMEIFAYLQSNKLLVNY